MRFRESENGIRKQLKFHSDIAGKYSTPLISSRRPFPILGKRFVAHRVKSLKLMFRVQSLMHRNRSPKVNIKNTFTYALNLTVSISMPLFSQRTQNSLAHPNGECNTAFHATQESALKEELSPIIIESMDRKAGSKSQSAIPMIIHRNLGMILSRYTKRFDKNDRSNSRKYYEQILKIKSKYRPTMPKADPVRFMENIFSEGPPEESQHNILLETFIPSVSSRTMRLDKTKAQPNLIGTNAKIDLSSGLVRIMRPFRGSQRFKLMLSILSPRFRLALQSLIKESAAVFELSTFAAFNSAISVNHIVPINRMTSIKNLYDRIMLKNTSNMSIFYPHYHPIEKSLNLKILTNESNLNLFHEYPRKEYETRAAIPGSEIELERERIFQHDTTPIPALDMEQFSDQICSIIEKRLKVERERRGLYG